MTALSKAIAKGYKATHDGVTKLYRKVTGKFGMTSNELIASGDDVGRVAGIVINSDEFAETLAKYSNGTLIKKFPNLSNAEEAIIRYYTGGSHEILNQALEGAVTLTDDLKAYRNLLRTALSKLPNHTGLVHRGVFGEEAFLAKTLKVGDNLTFNSFKFTSKSDEIAELLMNNNGRDVFFEIESKTGKAIENVSHHANEAEVLFDTGKRFKVIETTFKPRITPSDPLIKIIKLEEL